jgi:hypothetical protein
MNPELLLTHFNRISKSPEAVPRLRKFILELAVRGKLVEQDSTEEPASELMKTIQAEKARLVRQGEIKKLESFEPVTANDVPFPIPRSWEAIRMGWLARKLGAGSTPLGGKSVYQKEGVPFLRSQNVYDDGLRLDDVALISVKMTSCLISRVHPLDGARSFLPPLRRAMSRSTLQSFAYSCPLFANSYTFRSSRLFFNK